MCIRDSAGTALRRTRMGALCIFPCVRHHACVSPALALWLFRATTLHRFKMWQTDLRANRQEC
eukprot:14765188-Alexandrium_andersonii.AAC.1